MRRRLITLAAGMAFSFTTAFAQPQEPSNLDLLKDFIHFVRINNPELAASQARQLLDRGLTPAQFVDLVEQSQELGRFEESVARAMRVAETEPLAAELLKTFEQGKLERARNPDEIGKSIAALTGPLRGQLMARERLLAAGEYAMPQLLEALLDRSDLNRHSAVQRVMVDLGRQAIIPLCTAMVKLEPAKQESVADVLGLIPYRTSLPFLADLRQTSRSEAVKAACDRAMARLEGGVGATEPSDLYLQLGEGYYAEKSELTSFPGEEFQLLWSFDPGVGLVMVPVRTAVFHEAMAMRCAERALALQATNDAVALWVASNFSREIDTPEGYENPAYGKGRRDAMYFCVAAGPSVAQGVLGRAIDTNDTPLARRALAAVESMAGAQLWAGGDARRPLLEALTYPNRRVQYEAALALAAAQPLQTFPGAERVVPTLAGAIREASTTYAAVISADNETYQALRQTLEKAGYKVLPAGRKLDDLAGPIGEVPGVDLVVASGLGAEDLTALVEGVRGSAKLSATPVLALASPESYTDLRRRFERDVSVAVRPQAIGEQMLTESVDGLVLAASGGPIKVDEAQAYARRSLSALRDLAVSGNPVFNVGDAAQPLTAAMTDSTGATKLELADVLARVGQQRVQVALMDTAMEAKGDERVALLKKVTDSAKRFGNQLEARQVGRLTELASKGSEAEATAAAALMGALNLPNSQVVPLILGGGEAAARF
ncbi:MAG: hypothetical protein IT436_15690 [Phycisphaerales bacterium]|nr:hypothetical protein [Phycisphaerales bacterium]